MEESQNIDFVIPWVDGSDPAWLAEKRKWEGAGAAQAGGEANADCRYRDCGLLRYWFRAVEKFAPWVGRVFFVTCGQRPEWLDESNPRLRLVSHADYIPHEYLPTFHSDTIELNLHRIPDLSERFVLFNDDTFLLRPAAPGFFFRDGLPVVPCDLGVPRWIGCSNISRVVVNNAGVLKQGLDVERLVWRNIWKFADVRALGFVRAAKNVASFAVNRTWIPGTFGHLPMPHLKSTFEEVWRSQPKAMERTSRSRFRIDDGVNHWLAAAWNVASGRFAPANEKRRGEFAALDERSLAGVCGTVRGRSCPQLCLNDRGGDVTTERCYAEIAAAFGDILPEKSSFER
ncbi:MAG: Stealth CR1 domain-containing protein [Kiritimatiellae bacterium]|nr:Stealth CR1 domain-containing protein [Kiritimatiellia bacterium]